MTFRSMLVTLFVTKICAKEEGNAHNAWLRSAVLGGGLGVAHVSQRRWITRQITSAEK